MLCVGNRALFLFGFVLLRQWLTVQDVRSHFLQLIRCTFISPYSVSARMSSATHDQLLIHSLIKETSSSGNAQAVVGIATLKPALSISL